MALGGEERGSREPGVDARWSTARSSRFVRLGVFVSVCSLLNFHGPIPLLFAVFRRWAPGVDEALTANSQVSILISDFSHLEDGDVDAGTASVTLNGIAREVRGGDAEALRQLHVSTNPRYRQFIEGDDIAVIAVTIERVRSTVEAPFTPPHYATPPTMSTTCMAPLLLAARRPSSSSSSSQSTASAAAASSSRPHRLSLSPAFNCSLSL